MTTLDLLGLFGGACFAYCGVPAAFYMVRKGSSVGTPVSIAWMISVGAVAMYMYLLVKYGFDWVLAVNYSVEFVSWATIVWYHYKPRRVQ